MNDAYGEIGGGEILSSGRIPRQDPPNPGAATPERPPTAIGTDGKR